MTEKQKSELPGPEDPNWLPIGADNALWVVGGLVRKGVQVAYRERGDDHIELMLLDPQQPPPEPLYVEGPSKYFYYMWAPDVFPPQPWFEEDLRLRRKAGLQEEKADAPPARCKPGPQPTADWKNRLTDYVRCLQRSGKQIPTAAKLAQWCGANLGYTPDVSEININQYISR
jgi:hypothetical protein